MSPTDSSELSEVRLEDRDFQKGSIIQSPPRICPRLLLQQTRPQRIFSDHGNFPVVIPRGTGGETIDKGFHLWILRQSPRRMTKLGNLCSNQECTFKFCRLLGRALRRRGRVRP